jgi:hypothetical protein
MLVRLAPTAGPGPFQGAGWAGTEATCEEGNR